MVSAVYVRQRGAASWRAGRLVNGQLRVSVAVRWTVAAVLALVSHAVWFAVGYLAGGGR